MNKSEEILAGVNEAMVSNNIAIKPEFEEHFKLLKEHLAKAKNCRELYSISLGMALALMNKD